MTSGVGLNFEGLGGCVVGSLTEDTGSTGSFALGGFGVEEIGRSDVRVRIDTVGWRPYCDEDVDVDVSGYSWVAG